MDTIAQLLQTAALTLGAIWNAVMAYEAYPKLWKAVLSTLVALMLAVMALNKVLRFYG